ncbi:Hypothetical_protein [Hexamita inflata]|uniref:Hypothetical_protein n=1 Tax=Hexamita inflata TaxID=28002 RepID=A0ABP1GE62_9EUKA
MIFATVICSVRWIKWSPQEALQSFQQSKDDVLDLVECNSNVYQVMKDGTVQMRGMKYGLLNKESFEFVKLDISSVSRVFCISGQVFGYFTQSGQCMVENGFDSGKVQFATIQSLYKELQDEQVLSINVWVGSGVIFTTTGLFVSGSCANFFCGIEDKFFFSFEKVSFTQFTSPIASIRIHDVDTKNLFIYLENGDVYLTGKIDKFPITQDSVPIRKIGSGIKSVYLGWNASIVQNVLYYLKGTDLIMYSSKLSPNEQVIKTGVREMMYHDNIIHMLMDETVELFYQRSKFTNNFELYCHREPSDPHCIKIQENTFKEAQDCPADPQSEVCKLKKCATNLEDPQCSYSGDCQKNSTCWALWCKNSDSVSESSLECYTQYSNVTIALPTSKKSYFRGKYLFSDDQPNDIIDNQDNNYKISPEAAAGIAIAACVVVFVLILTIVIVQLKKKQLNTAIATESTEVILPELTTAQSIEVQ